MQLTLISSYSKNSDLVIGSQEIRNNYLYGITINPLFINIIKLNFSDVDIEFHIRAAQKEIENYLGVKLTERVYNETVQFDNDNWRHWGYLPTTYPVNCPLQLEGFLNTTKVATYPQEWLSVKKTSEGELPFKQIYMVPSGNTGAITNTVVFAGLLPNLGYMNAGKIPNYWTMTYSTGFKKVPYDIIQAIGELATISILYILGANMLGFPGMQSQSVSIDGLSQSLSSSLNAFGNRIQMMYLQLQDRLVRLKGFYTGIVWSAV